MKELLNAFFWMILSLKSHIDLESCKLIFPDMHKRFQKGSLQLGMLDKNVADSLEFYIKYKDYV